MSGVSFKNVKFRDGLFGFEFTASQVACLQKARDICDAVAKMSPIDADMKRAAEAAEDALRNLTETDEPTEE